MYLLLNAGMSLVESGLLSPIKRRKAAEMVSRLYGDSGGGVDIVPLRRSGLLGMARMG